jgi:hypothetical protein
MIEHISHDKTHLAIIIRNNFSKKGIEFFTSDKNPLQLGYMNREKDFVIAPHTHNKVERKINTTHEVLFIKSGKIRIDFYTTEKKYLKSTIAYSGDVILLTDGGHGFKMLEESEIIEVKQGPYLGEKDKNRFVPLEETKVIYRKTT